MSTMPPVYHFDSAIVRQPAVTVTCGLRAEDRGSPTYAGVRAEHQAYIAALEAAGIAVQILEPLADYPDSLFVEDPALVFHEGAIILRPGAKSRENEAALIEPVLRERFKTVLTLPDGHVDGGDVLVLRDRVMIGLSARTDRRGGEALIDCLAQIGRQGQLVETPPGVLHLKSDCSLIDQDTMLVTRRLAASGIFAGLKTLLVPDGEEAAANALRVNDRLLVGAEHSATIALLRQHGLSVTPLRTAEIAKIDAGLSCMSLRWINQYENKSH